MQVQNEGNLREKMNLIRTCLAKVVLKP